MDDKSLYNQNIPERENILQLCLHDLGEEEEGPVASSPGIWLEGNIGGRQLISDCRLHSNIQCSESCAIQSYPSFIDDQSRHLHRFRDLAASHIVCTAVPALTIPLNIALLKRFAERFKLHKRGKNSNYYGSTLLQYKSSFGHGKVVVSPSAKWIYASTGADEKARNLLDGSLVIHLADLQSKEMKITDSTRSPSLSYTPVEKLRVGYSLGKRRSGSKISDLTFISSSSSTCSYQSELSEYDLVLKGLLRCMWKDGLPCFVFSMTDNHGEVYIAKPLKIKSLNNKALDYIYIFYSRTIARKGGCFNQIYHAVGKMTVSSCLSFSSNHSKLMETEFVLFDATGDKKDTMGSSTVLLRGKGLPEKLLSVFRQTNVNSQNSSRYDDFEEEFSNLLKEPCVDEFSQLVEVDHHILFKDGFLPNHELSAIIIKDNQITNRKAKAAGGWGLKFLEMHDDVIRDQSHELSTCSGLGTVDYKSSRSMQVLIPAGSHGGPTTKVGGPSSLIQRWRTGGRCDCGGWDIGCPISVLHNQPMCGTASPMESSPEDLKLVDLFVEGAKQGEPAALRMVVLDEGLYAFSFQSKLSALQAFSVGVATIHSQDPTLRPEL